MLAPLEAVAAAAVAPIDNAQKSANATAARAPADLPMANQQTGVPTTLNHPAGNTTLPGAVDLKTGTGRQLVVVPHVNTATAKRTSTENNPTEQSHAHATTTAARPVTYTTLQGTSALKNGIGQPAPVDPQPMTTVAPAGIQATSATSDREQPRAPDTSGSARAAINTSLHVGIRLSGSGSRAAPGFHGRSAPLLSSTDACYHPCHIPIPSLSHPYPIPIPSRARPGPVLSYPYPYLPTPYP